MSGHKRGMELHAWFNPFRARPGSASTEGLAENTRRQHASGLGEEVRQHAVARSRRKGAQDLTYEVFMDVVKRYDVDGIHIDDYFYPTR
jgi:uncharacterized lipoprotein YddW (UPF0748 family)